jgi:large subunit ribosomal protein L28
MFSIGRRLVTAGSLSRSAVSPSLLGTIDAFQWRVTSPSTTNTNTTITSNSATPTTTQVRYRSGRSRRGLYDGKDVRAGNNVSFSMKTTKRKFKPNVFLKRVYSEVLDEMIRFHVTTSALRSIDKAGGLDNYLLKSKHVVEGEGLEAKKKILKVLKKQEKRKQMMTSLALESTPTNNLTPSDLGESAAAATSAATNTTSNNDSL